MLSFEGGQNGKHCSGFLECWSSRSSDIFLKGLRIGRQNGKVIQPVTKREILWEHDMEIVSAIEELSLCCR